MSRHRKKQRKSFAWPILVFGGILLIVAGFLFANKARGSKVESVTQDGRGTAAIVVDQQKIDYGYVTFGNNKTFKIKVTNNGDGALRFQDKPYIEVLEGC
ncbi:MAG: hypothetical protein ACXWNQ_07575 [Anaerolineales bacterium]